MVTNTTNLIVKVPEMLQWRAKAIAHLRGETIADVVRDALVDYVATGEEDAKAVLAGERDSDAEDTYFVQTVLARIAEGAPTYSHDEVWREIERLEAAGELPD